MEITAGQERFIVFAGTTNHHIETREEAIELAESLRRYETRVEVERHFAAYDADEGEVVWFSEVIA